MGSKKEGTVRRENLRGVGRRILAGDGRARVERPAAAKGESHENRRRGRRYECLFFSFFFYYPGRTETSSESVDGGGMARVNPEMYLPPKERSYGNQSMTTTTTTGSNAASNEGIVERKGGRESKVAFSRLVDGARSVIASAGISSTLPTVVMEDIGEENEDVDSMRLNPINSNGTSSSNGSSSRTSRTLIAVKWNPPEHDPFATILVGGNIEQLGSWTPENCVHMKNIGGNKWIADLGHIAAATEINFKFVVESENFGRRAETGEVRNFDVPVLRGGETRFTYVARQAPRW